MPKFVKKLRVSTMKGNMKAHLLGKDQFSEKDGGYSPAYGTSLVVRMFFAIATGEVPVHEPDNGFRTVRLGGRRGIAWAAWGSVGMMCWRLSYQRSAVSFQWSRSHGAGCAGR